MKSKYINSNFFNASQWMLKHCAAAIFMLLTFNIAAQPNFTSKEDALQAETQLKKESQDTAKVSLLLKLSEWYRNSEVKGNKALFYANKAYSLSQELSYTKGVGGSYLEFSKIEQSQAQYQKALLFARKAVAEFLPLKEYNLLGESYVMVWSASTLCEKPIAIRIEMLKKASEAFLRANKKIRSADCLKELGDIYQSDNRIGEALVVLKEAELQYKSSKSVKVYGLYDLLGTVYKQLGDYKRAIQYGLMAVRDAEKFGEKGLMLCTIYNRLGETYYAILDMKNALDCLDKSLAIAIKYNDPQSIYIVFCNKTAVMLVLKRNTEAKSFLLKMMKQYPKLIKDDDASVAGLLFEIYKRLGEKELASANEKKLLKLFNDPKQDSHSRSKICGLFIRQSIKEKNTEKAAYYTAIYSKMMEKHEIDKEYASGLFLWKFRIDSLNKNYLSAINNYQLYKKEMDTISIEQTKRQVNQFNIIYETEKKDRNIKRLKKTEEVQQANLAYEKKMRNTILIVLLLVIIILILAVMAFYEKQKSNTLLKKKQDEINLKNKSLRKLVTDKEWLLREIHHRVKNNLHMVVGLLASQAEFIKGKEALQVIGDSQHRIQAMSIIHQKLYQTETLSHINMSEYVQELVEYLKSSLSDECGVRFNLVIEPLTFPLSHSIPIGLIINEAVTNSIKYAFRENPDCAIGVSLKNLQDSSFLLEIRDNGIGMPEEFDLENSNSLGMRLIEGLSHDIHAELKIYNNFGTVISITFEINETNSQSIAS